MAHDLNVLIILEEMLCRLKSKNQKEERMKRLIFVSLILGLFVSFAYAQMGSMMGDQKGEAGKGQMMMQKGMMEHGQLIGSMTDMTGQISDMMGKMSGMMKNMSPDRMKTMSTMMKDMSRQMMEMSKVMKKGTTSQKEMNMLQNKMTRMQKELSGMGMK
jgi:hypothetical protein